jgi:WD40 repeat protein
MQLFQPLSALSGDCAGAQRRGERDAATGHTGGVNDALITADGARVLTLSKDCTARVWDAATGACLHVLIGHSDTCGPDGRIKSCCSRRHWRGERVKDASIVNCVKLQTPKKFAVIALALSLSRHTVL